MPVYRNPDFRRLPAGLADIFARRGQNGFFASPEWYDLMARCALPRGSEVRAYTDERPDSQMAIVARTAPKEPDRQLASLANFYSIEHAILSVPGADVARGVAAVLAEMTADRPAWDRLRLGEFDPRDPGREATVAALRRAGFLVECSFASGTWYEETAALGFAEYLA